MTTHLTLPRVLGALLACGIGFGSANAQPADPPAADPASAPAVPAAPEAKPADPVPQQPAVAETAKKDAEKKLDVNQWAVGPVVLTALGEIRYRNEFKDSYTFDNEAPKGQRSWDLLRVRLGGKASLGPLTVGVMGQDNREFVTKESAVTQYDPVDLQQLYLDLRHPLDLPVYLTVGRQEINLGSEMLIQSPGWTNFYRSFDMVRLGADGKTWQVDAFLGRVVLANKDGFDESRAGQNFWGVFGSYKTTPLSAELYLYGLHDQPLSDPKKPLKGEDGVVGSGTRYTPGFRLYGAFLKKALSYEFEAAFQFGNRANDEIRAWGVHGHVQYAFDLFLKPRLRLDYNRASGDQDPKDGVYQTFNSLYGSTHARYGLIDFFRWQNMQEVAGTVGLKPHKMVNLSLEYHAYWLDTTHDAWVNSGAKALRKIPTNPDEVSDFVGHELSLVGVVSPIKQLKLEVGYALFVPEDYVRQTGKSDPAQAFWVLLQAQL